MPKALFEFQEDLSDVVNKGQSITSSLENGLVATQDLLIGQLIFTEEPFLLFRYSEDLQEVTNTLNSNSFSNKSALFWKLAKKHHNFDEETAKDIIIKHAVINEVKTNNNSNNNNDNNTANTLTLYNLYAQMRHSCVPNIHININDQGILCAYALRNIPKGTELTHSRIPINLTHIERQHYFAGKFQRACFCYHCNQCEYEINFKIYDDNYRTMINTLSKYIHHDKENLDYKQNLLNVLNLTTICELAYTDKNYNGYSDLVLLKYTHLLASKLFYRLNEKEFAKKHLQFATGYSIVTSGWYSKDTQSLLKSLEKRSLETIQICELPILYYYDQQQKNINNDIMDDTINKMKSIKNYNSNSRNINLGSDSNFITSSLTRIPLSLSPSLTPSTSIVNLSSKSINLEINHHHDDYDDDYHHKLNNGCNSYSRNIMNKSSSLPSLSTMNVPQTSSPPPSINKKKKNRIELKSLKSYNIIPPPYINNDNNIIETSVTNATKKKLKKIKRLGNGIGIGISDYYSDIYNINNTSFEDDEYTIYGKNKFNCNNNNNNNNVLRLIPPTPPPPKINKHSIVINLQNITK